MAPHCQSGVLEKSQTDRSLLCNIRKIARAPKIWKHLSRHSHRKPKLNRPGRCSIVATTVWLGDEDSCEMKAQWAAQFRTNFFSKTIVYIAGQVVTPSTTSYTVLAIDCR